MSERDLTVSNSDRNADDWERGTTTRAGGGDVARAGVSGWLGARIETAIARLTQRFSRLARPPPRCSGLEPFSR